MLTFGRTLLYGASALSMALASNAAAAQDANSGAAGTTNAKVDPGQVATAPSETGLADIVVTAQRRSENLQRTGLAVSAVSATDLAKANITDVASLTKIVPSLISAPSTGGTVNFYLRGVGAQAGNAFTDNPVAINFGPVYIARPGSVLGTFYDLERVEVLKGPQGTLYGRNASGGAVNVIPHPATLGETGADISLEAGNYRSVRAQAAVNLALGNDAALRIAGQVVSRDGYLSDGTDDEVGQAVRASLRVAPSSAVRVDVVADYSHQGGQGIGAVLVQGPFTATAPDLGKRIGGSDPRSLAALSAAFPLYNTGLVQGPKNDAFVNNNVWGIYSDIEVDLGFAKLSVIPAYRDSRPDFLGYSLGYPTRVDEQSRQKSMEVRLASPGSGALNYVVGAYYFDEDQHSFNGFNQGIVLNTLIDANLTTKSYALFGQASLKLSDTFRIVAGARQTWDNKTNDTVLTSLSFGVGPSVGVTGKANFSKFTYKAGIEWDAGPHSLIYANVATGYKSGGFFVAAVDNVFQPEAITAYTLGAKNRFFDNKLQLNIEAFRWDYKDQQVNYVGLVRTSPTDFGVGLATANAGKSRITGAEAELLFQLTPDDLFGANVQYLDSKYQEFSIVQFSPTGAPPITGCAVSPSTTVASSFNTDCSGKPQLNSPKWSVNLSYEHRFKLSGDLSFALGGRTKIESSRYLAVEYLPDERQGGYMMSDLYATLASRKDRWSLTAFVNNVENKTVIAASSLRSLVPAIYAVLRPPRTLGLRGAISF